MRIIAICVFICIFLFSVSGCSNQESDVITLDKDGSIDSEDCMRRGLDDRVYMLESKYCPHCKATLPDFKEACREKGVEFVVLDLSIKEQREQMESHGLNVVYTPTFIFGCDYFIGVRPKEYYLQALDEFLKS